MLCIHIHIYTQTHTHTHTHIRLPPVGRGLLRVMDAATITLKRGFLVWIRRNMTNKILTQKRRNLKCRLPNQSEESDPTGGKFGGSATCKVGGGVCQPCRDPGDRQGNQDPRALRGRARGGARTRLAAMAVIIIIIITISISIMHIYIYIYI